ncbi:hypothetical protein PtB15_6B488 [Puccinia triticina]|nr:hypothetical protein PtB15_6B488 [Puccinia triticina]
MAIAPLLTYLSSVKSVPDTMRKLKKVWHNAGLVKVVQSDVEMSGVLGPPDGRHDIGCAGRSTNGLQAWMKAQRALPHLIFSATVESTIESAAVSTLVSVVVSTAASTAVSSSCPLWYPPPHPPPYHPRVRRGIHRHIHRRITLVSVVVSTAASAAVSAAVSTAYPPPHPPRIHRVSTAASAAYPPPHPPHLMAQPPPVEGTSWLVVFMDTAAKKICEKFFQLTETHIDKLVSSLVEKSSNSNPDTMLYAFAGSVIVVLVVHKTIESQDSVAALRDSVAALALQFEQMVAAQALQYEQMGKQVQALKTQLEAMSARMEQQNPHAASFTPDNID